MSWEATSWARKCGASGQLTPGEVLLLILLADHADEDWSCYPSQERLAVDSNQGERTVRRQIGRLRELGLIATETRYGESRGRLGMRYYLLREGLEALPKREAENRENPRPANLAGKGFTGHQRSNYRPNRASAPYKDRARMNPQESPVHLSSVRQPGSVRADETDGPTDGPMTGNGSDPAEVSATPSTSPSELQTRQGREHRGVDLDALTERVPAAAELDEAQLRLIVQVVLARASGPVRNPLAFVATSMTREFHELVAITAQHVPAPRVEAPEAGGGQVRQFPAREPVPCRNPDHAGYGSDVLRDCPHCRIEAKAAPAERQAQG